VSDPRPSRQPPARVRVTGPPRRAATRRTPAADIDEQTPLGGVYLGSLLRAQLGLAGRVLLALALTVGLLPLLFALVPGLASVRVLGLPLSWVVVGGLSYPWLLVLGWVYVRRAERHERDFAALLGRADDRDPRPDPRPDPRDAP